MGEDKYPGWPPPLEAHDFGRHVERRSVSSETKKQFFYLHKNFPGSTL